MRCLLAVLCLLAGLAALVHGDCYMHNPRGSNNRWKTNQDNPEVENNNRLFDSQNNDDGGYDNARETDAVTPLQYVVGSRLVIQWATQHSCGKDSTVNCEIVLQYMCGRETDSAYERIRDGETNNRVEFNADTPDTSSRVTDTYGIHETYHDYLACNRRRRNPGLFIADRTLNGNTAEFTRQNNNGDRRGFECPEERDYYPYWAPSRWRDIAIVTDTPAHCKLYYENSQNIVPKYKCVDAENLVGEPAMPYPAMYIDPQTCAASTVQGTQRRYTWQRVDPHFHERGATPANPNVPFWGAGNAQTRRECVEWRAAAAAGRTIVWGNNANYPITAEEANTFCQNVLGAPDCVEPRWQRDNHLGTVHGGYLANYTWLIPNDVSPNCVLRIRYNMTSLDYDGWNTFAEANRPKTLPDGIPSQDPYVFWLWASQPLRLALNTNQYGRTFQDRSHVFSIVARRGTYTTFDPTTGVNGQSVALDIPDDAAIHNVNVRGKRGHISQVYPSVTLDFVPREVNIRAGDYVHFQWEGASTGPQSYIGGGTPRLERSNLVQIANMKSNWPLPSGSVTMFPATVAMHFAMAGQEILPATGTTACKTMDALMAEHQYNPNGSEQERFQRLDAIRRDSGNCAWLNRARATFFHPPVQFNTPGSYYYVSTRNNFPGVQAMKGAVHVSAA